MSIEAVGTLHAPWSDEQVQNLNEYQQWGGYLPRYTCGDPHEVHPGEVNLTATPAGWVCPGCDYTQSWAHEYAAESEWRHDSQFW